MALVSKGEGNGNFLLFVTGAKSKLAPNLQV